MKYQSILWLLLIATEFTFAASYDRVYSIQMGAFRDVQSREAFIKHYQQLPLYCRKNSRNAYVVYYGVFQSYQDAKPHLQDIPDKNSLGAYVVQLDNVRLKPCSNMLNRLQALY